MGLSFAKDVIKNKLALRNSSRFLIIKDDLICRIIWRAGVGVSLLNTARKFHDLNVYPRTYYFCLGATPPEYSSNSLETKCDEDNVAYQALADTVYSLTYLTFCIAVCFEKERQKRALASSPNTANTSNRSMGVVMDNSGFLINMIVCVISIIVYEIYDKGDINQIVTFPGSLSAYFIHLFLFPMTAILMRGRRILYNESLKAYFKRVIFGNQVDHALELQ